MGTTSNGEDHGGDDERVTLRVDDRGRITIPKHVRERLGIGRDDRVEATVSGSVLQIDPRPSSSLETAAADRDDWSNTTPTDAGESLFGPFDADE